MGGPAVHRLEPEALVEDAGHPGAERLGLGEKVLSNTEDDPVHAPREVDWRARIGIALEAPAKLFREASGHERSDIVDECAYIVLPDASSRENLFELGEREDRHEELVPLVPQLGLSVVKVFPQSLR